MDSNKTGLLLKDLSMIYRTPDGSEIEALKEISFSLDSGGFLTVLGPSGCGKTTLLNVVAGFLAPTSGEVSFNDMMVEGPHPQRGMVFQQGALFEWMSVENNVSFGPRMAKQNPKLIQEKTEYWLEVVGLADFSKKSVYELSGGMQQRVALARCLANEPDLILMDEPLGALDALTREKMQGLLLKLWKETQKTIVLITHSVEEAIALGERLFVMAPRPGRLEKQYNLPFAERGVDGDSRAIKAEADFVAVREEILAMIWEMEEEIMGRKEGL